jgi:hypothetical protein
VAAGNGKYCTAFLSFVNRPGRTSYGRTRSYTRRL